MDGINQKLQDLLDKQIGKGYIRSVVAAVQSCDRRVDFSGASGIANHETGTSMTPDTPYFIASVSKTYTAAIVMRLDEQRLLDLDAPITEYLPDSMIDGIHVYKGVDYSAQIKVSNLIEHSSGLPDHESGKPAGGKSLMDELKAGIDREVSNQEAVEITRRLNRFSRPGLPEKRIIRTQTTACWRRSSHPSAVNPWRRLIRNLSARRSDLSTRTCSTGLRPEQD